MKLSAHNLDRINPNILKVLQLDGRISNVELSQMVGLSSAPCLVRVKRLEPEDVIESYRAKLNPVSLRFGLLAFIEVTLERANSG